MTTQAYGEEWYWDKRYEQEPGPFDWYQKYQSLSPILRLYIPRTPHHSALVVGCGNSGMPISCNPSYSIKIFFRFLW